MAPQLLAIIISKRLFKVFAAIIKIEIAIEKTIRAKITIISESYFLFLINIDRCFNKKTAYTAIEKSHKMLDINRYIL